MHSATHSAFAFAPASVLASPAEIERMQGVIAESNELSTTSGLRKQKKLLEQWLDDERHPQIEIITYPVCFTL